MNRFRALFLPLAITSVTLSCGSGRQLQSIAVSRVASDGQIQFVATGTFSAPPVTVSPLKVFWSFAPPPSEYALTNQPFVFQCEVAGPYPSPLIAWAPSDPNAPSSGSISGTKMVSGSGRITCP